MKSAFEVVDLPREPAQRPRVDWIDYAKGICIILVVMFQATHGVEDATGKTGWLSEFTEFARPFRMPDFFLVSGLLLSRVIGRDWRTYLDRKVVHFAYFYVLWLTIQFAFKAPFMAAEQGWMAALESYLLSFVSPFASLWFIYLLPFFFVVTKLVRRVNPLLVFGVAALLEILPAPGIRVLDKFTLYFVYFYTGYILAPRIFAYAEQIKARPAAALLGLLAWAGVNGWLVLRGYSVYPVVSLALGLVGAGVVIAVSALVARQKLLPALAYCGKHSLVIYLAYFLPMAATRVLLLKTGWVTDIGTVSLLCTVAGVLGALVIYWLARGTWLRLLFERPAMFKLHERGGSKGAPQPRRAPAADQANG